MSRLSVARLDSRLSWATAAGAIALLIFFQSSRTAISIQDRQLDIVFGESRDEHSNRLNELLHDLAHLALFAALAFSLHRATGYPSMRSAALAAGAAFMYGVSDEWHQSFVAGREGALSDLALDLVGAVTGSYGSLFTLHRMLPGDQVGLG